MRIPELEYEYKTVQEESQIKFDEECNKLSKEGWSPSFAIDVLVITGLNGESYTKLTQQWYKTKNSKTKTRNIHY